jgi:transposase
MGGAQGSAWTFQQDNDPTHRGTKGWIKEWKQKRGNVEFVDNWPPNSPDLNPIENIWAWVNKKVREKGCSSFKEFQAEVQNTLKNIPQSFITNLYESMPKRISKVLENEGDRIKY